MLNPHVFRIVPYPGLAPELATRSGQGSWDAYALAAPADRLLPFVVTRTLVPGASQWLNCATIVNADTEQVLFTLTPTGQTFAGPSAQQLVFSKVVDAVQGVEHFLYLGALIPGVSLPCGIPLRLLLDTQWQSPRFYAYASLSGFQLLEWSHPGPLSGVPYGTGLVQRFYVDNGGLQYAAPREVKTSQQDAATGALRLDYLAKYRSATATVAPVPGYLAEAFTAAEAHARFTVEGERWRVTAVKEAAQGPDGGRWLMTLSLEQQQVLQSRLSCPPDPLTPTPYDPVADRPRGWRCFDDSDTDSDYLPTGVSSCEVDADGYQTGFYLEEIRDSNPYSPTFGRTDTRRTYDATTCPLPIVYRSAPYSEAATRSNCPSGQVGSSVILAAEQGKFSSRVSQQDADNQAVAYVQANKQAYANANGTCSTSGATGYAPIYYAGGCFSQQMRNRQDPSDVRDATPEESAQYTRQNDNNGQPCPL